MALPRSLNILLSPFFLSHSAAPRCQRSAPRQETADKLAALGKAEGRALLSAWLPSSALPCYHDKTCIFSTPHRHSWSQREATGREQSQGPSDDGTFSAACC